MKKVKVRVFLVTALVLVLCSGCGEEYTCDRCEETTKEDVDYLMERPYTTL